MKKLCLQNVNNGDVKTLNSVYEKWPQLEAKLDNLAERYKFNRVTIRWVAPFVKVIPPNPPYTMFLPLMTSHKNGDKLKDYGALIAISDDKDDIPDLYIER